MRIRGEIKMLEGQLRANDDSQQSGAAGADLNGLESLKQRLEGVCKMQGFKDMLL